MPLDNGDELFYHVDKNDKVIGSIPRRKAHADKTIIHRGVGIIILNHEGLMLWQQRSMSKDMDPGLWSYGVGGHVTYGSTYRQTALRELQEEMHLSPTKLKKLKHTYIPTENETEFNNLYEAHAPIGWQPIPDPEEIQAITWVLPTQLKEFLATHPTYEYVTKTLTLTGYL